MGKHQEEEPLLTPLEILRIKYPHLSVLLNLVDGQGVSAVEQVIDQVLHNPNLRRIVIIGLPGSGKTTIALQLSEFLREEFEPLIVRNLNFDFIRKNLIFEHGKTEGWSSEVWEKLNQKLHAELQGMERTARNYEANMGQVVSPAEVQKTIFMVQLPLPGMKNRGFSFLKSLAGKPKAEKPSVVLNHEPLVSEIEPAEDPTSTFVISVVSPQSVRDRSSEIRTDVLETRVGLQQLLKDKYNIIVTKIKGSLVPDTIILRMVEAMATNTFIQSISDEFDQLVKLYLEIVKETIDEMGSRLQYMHTLIPLLETADNKKKTLEMIVMDWYLYSYLGFERTQAIQAFNMLLDDTGEVYYPLPDWLQRIHDAQQ